MTAEDAISYIDGVQKAQEITWVDITGGESFLYYDTMIEILTQAKKKGISGKVTTSAFWASDMSKATWVMQNLKKSGVDRLEIRYDGMYASNVEFERIKNATLAARQKGFILQVVSNYLFPAVEGCSDKGPYVGETSNETDRLTAELQRRLLEFLPKRCLAWERVRITDNDKKFMELLGERFAEARDRSQKAFESCENQNSRIDTAVIVNILPNGDLEVNGRYMGNAREKEAEVMVRDFIIETRMAF